MGTMLLRFLSALEPCHFSFLKVCVSRLYERKVTADTATEKGSIKRSGTNGGLRKLYSLSDAQNFRVLHYLEKGSLQI